MIKWIRTSRLSIKTLFLKKKKKKVSTTDVDESAILPTRQSRESELFIDNLPVRIYLIIEIVDRPRAMGV